MSKYRNYKVSADWIEPVFENGECKGTRVVESFEKIVYEESGWDALEWLIEDLTDHYGDIDLDDLKFIELDD